MSNRLYNAAIFNEAVYKPMKLMTNPVVVIAGILLAALLLASTFSVYAAEARTYRYNENRTDPVATYAANRAVKWTLSGTDAGDFKISENGVLTFAKTPNFEAPADQNTDNTYTVTIEASGTPLVNATITVIDVDDPGKVTLSHLQPAEGVVYEATAKDEDDGYRGDPNELYTAFESGHADIATLARWKWEKSQNGTSDWSLIADKTESTYTPVAGDVGYYLRVTVTYSDRDLPNDTTGDNADKNRIYAANAPVRNVSKVSYYEVKAANNTNQAPVFADNGEDKATAGSQQDRDVNENDKNALVGAPVSASDPGDVLAYKLVTGDTNNDGTIDSGDTDQTGNFTINRMTGQVSVKGTLNHEDDDAATNDGAEHIIGVEAEDPFGSSAIVTVTIAVNDVNDAPRFTTGSTGTSTGAVREGVVGATTTAGTAVDNTALIIGDDNTTPVTEAFNYIYTAEDLDIVDAANDTKEGFAFSLSGPDEKHFEDSDEDNNAATLQLAFKDGTKINYEKKKSYSVTVVVKDVRGKTAEKDVTIRVNNAEDPGSIKLSTRQPQAGISITATLADEDGIKGSITWEWGRAAAIGNSTDGWACPASRYAAITDGKEGRATKPTFTPTTADVGTGGTPNCIGVTATYIDRYPETDTVNDPLTKNADHALLPVRQSNNSPRFEKEGKVISSTTRSVSEDAEAGDTVGGAVTGTDPDEALGDGLSDNLTYSLHGADAATFDIDDDSGQIRVKAKLDYETKQTHSVTVRATDGNRASANIPVTITVTNVNEAPKVSGSVAVTYAENGTDAVGTYTAADPESDAVTWSVDGEDKDKFSISDGGVLSFKNPPDFEAEGAKADADGNNMYEVDVVATDTVEKTGKRSVSVSVTDVDDPGSISFGLIVQPGAGVPITAKLSDQDAADKAEATASYQWSIGDSGIGPFTDIENQTNTTYTPASGDAGKYLQFTAEYGADGNRKTVTGDFDHPVAAVDVANPVPVFPDQNLATKTKETDQEREVPENSAEGTAVGAPVTASDDDVRSYSIEDYTTGSNHSTYFKMNKVTGQISVSEAGAKKGQLDYEVTANNRYEVNVRATDANAASTTAKVTIIVTDVNEKPTVNRPTADPALTADELVAPENQKVIDADGTVGDPLVAATYTATDLDAGEANAHTWSLEGPDGDKFKISSGGTLSFDKAPDYEAKGSAAGTNAYKVTIVATDPVGNRGTRNVEVEVENVDEKGKIALSTVQPQVGVPITATLSDADGIDGKIEWTWTQAGDTTNDSGDKATFTPTDTGTLTVSAIYDDKLTAGTPATDDKRSLVATDAPNLYAIRGKQTSNARPEFRDDEGNKVTSKTRELEENAETVPTDVGAVVAAEDPNGIATVNHLTYTLSGPDAASFTIDRGNPTNAGEAATAVNTNAGQIKAKKALDYETKDAYTVIVTATDGSNASASVTVVINVLDVEPEPPKLAPPNKAPEFAEAAYELEVAEGTTPGRNVGDAVTATDEDEDDTLSYSLSGDDAESFAIDGNGQITTNAALVLATKGTYTLTVTADDGNKGTASAKVTITITAAPPPVFDDGESASRSIAENSAAGSSVGDPVTATVPEGDVLYALGGDDEGSFEIDINTGQITTAEGTSLDFESGATSYSVTVTATNATGGQASIDVAIDVDNVNEAGTLTVSPDQAELGVRMTASVSDPDGGVTGESWEWQWSETGATWSAIPGGRSASYTPSESDGGLLIRVAVEYSDASGEESELASPATGLPPVPEPPAPEPTPVPPAPTPTPVPPAPTPTPVPPTATPVPPTATPVPPAPTATPVPPAPTATPVPEDEGGFPAWLVVVIVLGLAAVIAAGVLVVRNRQQQQ